jgi:hypothetical protein
MTFFHIIPSIIPRTRSAIDYVSGWYGVSLMFLWYICILDGHIFPLCTRFVKSTSFLTGHLHWFLYFRCRLFSNIKRHTKMIGGRGLEKYFFHSSREVNSAVHTPWKHEPQYSLLKILVTLVTSLLIASTRISGGDQ